VCVADGTCSASELTVIGPDTCHIICGMVLCLMYEYILYTRTSYIIPPDDVLLIRPKHVEA
jgi:hypothetical protein